MGWFALISLIISVIRTAMELWPLIKDALDRIDGMSNSRARFEARGKLGQVLKAHKEGKVCSTTCAAELKTFTAAL